MAKSNRSYPENQKEVYKFWLGFFEKVAVLIFAVAIIPTVIGQLKYPPFLVVVWSGVIFIFLIVMIWLSRNLWYLPKGDDKTAQEKTARAKGEKP
jgi:hypothetical protein